MPVASSPGTFTKGRAYFKRYFASHPELCESHVYLTTTKQDDHIFQPSTRYYQLPQQHKFIHLSHNQRQSTKMAILQLPHVLRSSQRSYLQSRLDELQRAVPRLESYMRWVTDLDRGDRLEKVMPAVLKSAQYTYQRARLGLTAVGGWNNEAPLGSPKARQLSGPLMEIRDWTEKVLAFIEAIKIAQRTMSVANAVDKMNEGVEIAEHEITSKRSRQGSLDLQAPAKRLKRSG